jgi:preprotein translocase subunit SecE
VTKAIAATQQLVSFCNAIIIYSRQNVGVQVIGKVMDFLTLVKGEMKKVTWPSRKDTYASTLAVIVLVLAVGVFLWAVDSALSFAIRFLLRG